MWIWEEEGGHYSSKHVNRRHHGGILFPFLRREDSYSIVINNNVWRRRQIMYGGKIMAAAACSSAVRPHAMPRTTMPLDLPPPNNITHCLPQHLLPLFTFPYSPFLPLTCLYCPSHSGCAHAFSVRAPSDVVRQTLEALVVPLRVLAFLLGSRQNKWGVGGRAVAGQTPPFPLFVQ